MRHLLRALPLYWHSNLTWRAAWNATAGRGQYCLVKRDGLTYLEPRGGR